MVPRIAAAGIGPREYVRSSFSRGPPSLCGHALCEPGFGYILGCNGAAKTLFGDEQMILVYLVIALVAYLIGAIPVGVLVGATRGIDVRQHGSGKTGTTNVLRTVGKRAAAMVLFGDVLKGSLAVWIGRLIAEAYLTPEARVGWLD